MFRTNDDERGIRSKHVEQEKNGGINLFIRIMPLVGHLQITLNHVKLPLPPPIQ
jgi:hypothetical protein